LRWQGIELQMFNKAQMIIKEQKPSNSTETDILPMQCYTLRIQLEKLARFVAINQPSIMDEEGMELCQKRIGALNTIWELLDEVCP